ncbi:hypothetical protein DMP23_38660 [Amycolatopsis sp. A1MSW2902]
MRATLIDSDSLRVPLMALGSPRRRPRPGMRPNVALGASHAPNATLGASDAPNATLGRKPHPERNRHRCTQRALHPHHPRTPIRSQNAV